MTSWKSLVLIAAFCLNAAYSLPIENAAESVTSSATSQTKEVSPIVPEDFGDGDKPGNGQEHAGVQRDDDEDSESKESSESHEEDDANDSDDSLPDSDEADDVTSPVDSPTDGAPAADGPPNRAAVAPTAVPESRSIFGLGAQPVQTHIDPRTHAIVKEYKFVI